jgi:transcriptional antiterminator NusG
VLVEMELTDETWHLVRSTPKVTGFVGSGSRPVSLPADQVDEIVRNMEAGAEKPKPKSVFQRGDKVRVVDGPFVNFQGVVEDMNPERGRMKVVVPVFGRPTSVELEYYQVERL